MKFDLGTDKMAPWWIGAKLSRTEIEKRVKKANAGKDTIVIKNTYVVRLLKHYMKVLSRDHTDESIELLRKIDIYLGDDALVRDIETVIDVMYYLSNVSVADQAQTKLSPDELKTADEFINVIIPSPDEIRKAISELSSLENPSYGELYIYYTLISYMDDYYHRTLCSGTIRTLKADYRKTQGMLAMSAHNTGGPCNI